MIWLISQTRAAPRQPWPTSPPLKKGRSGPCPAMQPITRKPPFVLCAMCYVKAHKLTQHQVNSYCTTSFEYTEQHRDRNLRPLADAVEDDPDQANERISGVRLRCCVVGWRVCSRCSIHVHMQMHAHLRTPTNKHKQRARTYVYIPVHYVCI